MQQIARRYLVGRLPQIDSIADLAMWTRLEALAEVIGMIIINDVEEAMGASNFNEWLGPDGLSIPRCIN
jgi:hypothetical protein